MNSEQAVILHLSMLLISFPAIVLLSTAREVAALMVNMSMESSAFCIVATLMHFLP